MKKNVGSQLISAQMLASADGANITTGTVSVAVEIDGAAGTGGTATHIANGKWEYAPIQADTNGDHITFQYTHTSALTVLQNVYTDFPQTGDSYVRLGAPVDTDISTDIANVSTQVGSLSSGSAAISTIAASATVTTGSETLTYTATSELDGTLHEVADAAGSTEFYYEFDVGGNGVPVEFVWDGYAQSNGDSYTVKAYNWGTTSWDQIGTLTASNGTTVGELSFQATNGHVGTGANIGTVRLQFASADGTNVATDRVLCSYAVVAQSVGYADGAIWVNTLDGVAGTVVYVNGVADNPVLTWADALTIGTSLGIDRYRITNGSTITLSADSTNHTLIGENWTLALGGQDISGIAVIGSNGVTGTGVNGGAVPRFDRCLIGDVTIPPVEFLGCCLTGTVTASAAGDYFFVRCHSLIAGTATPTFNFGAAIGSTNLNFRGYSGGIEIENMGQSGTDVMSLEGDGQLVINANCTGGTVAIRGNYTITDNAGDVLTLAEDARFSVTQLHSDGAAINTTAGAVDTVTTNTDMRGTDGANTVVPDAAGTINVTGGAVDTVIDVTNRVTANADQIAGNATSATNLSKSALGIEPGAAITGTLSTTEMTTDLTEATDDHYIGRIIIWTSGVLANQATDITDYDGASKLLTYTATTEAPSNTDTFVIV